MNRNEESKAIHLDGYDFSLVLCGLFRCPARRKEPNIFSFVSGFSTDHSYSSSTEHATSTPAGEAFGTFPYFGLPTTRYITFARDCPFRICPSRASRRTRTTCDATAPRSSGGNPSSTS
jgi:hypothetical protein